MGKPFGTPIYAPPKPIETRDLWLPTRSTPQGKLRLWVDIMTPDQARACPVVPAPHPPLCCKHNPPPFADTCFVAQLDIARPPQEEYELRVVVWRTWGVKSAEWVHTSLLAA